MLDPNTWHNLLAMAGKDEMDFVSKLKDGTSYPLWEKEIKILFRAKKLIKIVEGKEEKPTTDESKIEEWEQKDALAQYYIMRTIDQSVKTHVLTSNTSHETFKILSTIFKKDTEQQKGKLWSAFYNFKINKSMSMSTNISELSNAVFRLNTMGEKINDEMLIERIICALNDCPDYKHFSSAWDSASSEDKTLANLKIRLDKEEEKIKGRNQEEKVAFKATYNKNEKKSRNKQNNNNQQKGNEGKNNFEKKT